LLPDQNPVYICEEECGNHVEENYKSLLQEGIIIVQAIINMLFEEALSLRVSSEYGGGHDTTEEERYSTPRWHEGHTKLVYAVHQTTRTHGGAARPTSLLDTIIRSTSIRSATFQVWVYYHDGGGGEEAHSP
jgi:hypothetical protein